MDDYWRNKIGRWMMGKEKAIQFAKKFIKGIPKSTWTRIENSANPQLAVLAGTSDKEVID